MTAIPTGDGPDMHYHDVGARTVKKGESILFEVASASAPYRRLVEWLVPDTHTPEGQPTHAYQPQSSADDGSPWDVLEFQNPFEFPMTTAPAMVTANGRTLGQNTSHWTNRGETTRLRVTKALSIRTSTEEHELDGPREHVIIGGRTYRKASIEGTLRIANNRAETVDVLVRRRFSGELLKSSEDAKTRLLEDGAWSANRRNELIWNLTLQPGQEKTLAYAYSILVPL